MNKTSLYPNLADKRCYTVEAYGQIDVWSFELDEPIGCVPSYEAYERIARAAGWEPMYQPHEQVELDAETPANLS